MIDNFIKVLKKLSLSVKINKPIAIAGKQILIVLLFALALLINFEAKGQVRNLASPSNWLYPDGNSEATRYNSYRSGRQTFDSIKQKWSTPLIFGDVKPLIGNIINNDKLFPYFRWAPNEIAAVMGDSLIVIDGMGRLRSKSSVPNFVSSVSVLMDTLATHADPNVVNLVVMGLATLEHENHIDSNAYAYIAGYSQLADTVSILTRLAINLRNYKPNIFASVKPVFARRNGTQTVIYATVNMSKPTVTSDVATNPAEPPFFRGLTSFAADSVLATYPFPDLGDDPVQRITVGPEVNLSEPSISLIDGDRDLVLLPSFPTPNMQYNIPNIPTLTRTWADSPYLLGYDLSAAAIDEYFPPQDVSSFVDINGKRPIAHPYFVKINDKKTSDSVFIFLAEEYSGLDNSSGNSFLHLWDKNGVQITSPGDPLDPPIAGAKNHLWSVAIADVDGIATNEKLPYYPNFSGRELIVTQSSRNLQIATSRLMVFRYYTGDPIVKPPPYNIPPNDLLHDFDTIVTQRINGWVAAVNDFDGAPDGKDEIFLADGSTLFVLRLRDYNDYQFRSGQPFDTVFKYEFQNQTISSVAIADMEGDGLNDIIVTTYKGSYVIGSMVRNILQVLQPKVQFIPPEEYCAGDTVKIRWRNYIRSQGTVDVWFQPFIGGQPDGSPVEILRNYPNPGDTAKYDYIVDKRVLAQDGKFYVAGTSNSYSSFDSTSILRFDKPAINIDPLSNLSLAAGSQFNVTGTARCVDSVAIEFSYDRASWQRIRTSRIDIGGVFSLRANVPCVDFFSCTDKDLDSIIYIHVLSFRGSYADTSSVIPLIVRPAALPVSFVEQKTADPTKVFTWDLSKLAFPCDTVVVSYSPDCGGTFTHLENIPATASKFTWQVPYGLPYCVVMRFCCQGSCVRLDTLLNAIRPKYIGIVAPNPFKPPLEVMEVVYKVPEETNVTIRIYDQSNRLVAEPVKGSPRSPNVVYSDSWNGTILDGSLAANGMYYLSLELSNGIRELYSVFVRK